MINLKNVEIGYKSSLLNLEQIHIKRGEIFAVIGENGAGKSTLLKTLTGQIHPIQGQIIIEEKNFQLLNRKEKAKLVSFVGSKFDGIPYLKVLDYLTLGRTPHTDLYGRLTPQDKKTVDHIIELLHIESFIERYTLELSDGERQLVAIGRALVQNTPVICLDEPTAFLDYGNRKKLIRLLSEVAKKEQKCILFSSHDIDLCIDEKIPVLLINTNTKKLEQYNSISKEEIIQKGFASISY